jgi:hypothetical protein
MKAKSSYFGPFCHALKFRNNVKSTNLAFGICPFPEKLLEQFKIEQFKFDQIDIKRRYKIVSQIRCFCLTQTFSSFANAQNYPMTQYKLLALCQDTKFAVTPVHTEQERHLFTSLIQQYIHDSDDGKTITNWKSMNKQ